VTAVVDFTVVVPLFNGGSTVRRQLEALKRQTFRGNWEVVVADNGSTDNGPELVSEWIRTDSRFRLVTVERPGSPAARNDAAQGARGTFLAFCDDDDEVEAQWLGAYARAAAQQDNPDCQLVGPLDVESLASEKVWGASGSPYRQPVAAGRPYGAGANNAIRRELFLQMGGYSEDSDLRCGYDVDLSWRLLQNGGSIVFVPEAVVQKRPKATAIKHAAQWFGYGRSSSALYRRHPAMSPNRLAKAEKRLRRRQLGRDFSGAIHHPWGQRWVLAQMVAYQCGRFVGAPPPSGSKRHYR
jgi:glycosyltransferase involved in cell wall biosynthesis